MSNVFLTDVLDQPRAMRKAMAHYAQYGALLEKIGRQKPAQVLFTGMGSSHYCSQSAVIRLNAGGLPARMESAAELLHYESGALTPGTLLVLTSQSGESGEIVDLIDKLPAAQTVVGITNNPGSTLGRRADICLEMRVENELAVSTRTYLAALVLSDMLASALLGTSVEESLAQCRAGIDALARTLDTHERTQALLADFLGRPSTLCYIGRGHARATAECGALFTRETAKYPALAFDSGEFRHGPFEMVDARYRAILFAPAGATCTLQRHLTEAICAHGGRVAFITDEDARFATPNALVLRHDAVPERIAPLVQVAFAQLFANDMALYRGFAPGVFRQSSKITTAQ